MIRQVSNNRKSSIKTAPTSTYKEIRGQKPMDGKTTVYYDGACPLCLSEIDYYKRRDSTSSINWIDATRCEQSLLGIGLSRDDALKRFHVRSPEGHLLSGAEAFSEVWSTLPGFSWLGRIARTRVIGGCLEILYRGFLIIRPGIQKIYRAMNQ